MWSERHDNHLVVYWRGQPIYKNWADPKHPSILFNPYGLNEWIV